MDELDNDPEFDSALARINAAEQADIEADFTKEIGERRQRTEHPIQTWVTNLPKNIGIGAYKAAINTVDTIADFGSAALEANANAALSRGPSNAGRTDSSGEEIKPINVPTLEEAFPEFSQSVRSFTDSWERNDNLGDDIAQGIAQFTLPFAGTLKLLGGMRAGAGTMATLARAGAAEGVTAGSAFDPHDGRLADLVKLGMDSESRFGDLMRKIAPDGSLVNSYIDYMTARDGRTPDERRNGVSEGEWEGRFKNSVDSLVGSAAIAGIVKSAGIAFRGLKQHLAGAVPVVASLATPSSSPKAEQPGLLQEVYSEYPALAKYGFQFKDSVGAATDGRKLEFYPPGESRSPFSDKSKPGIERFDAEMSKKDVLGEMLHFLPSVDPDVGSLRRQFQGSITEEQKRRWLQGDYDAQIAHGVFGDKPPTFEKWLDHQGGDAFFRGYLAGQYPERAYTRDQKVLFTQLDKLLRAQPGKKE